MQAETDRAINRPIFIVQWLFARWKEDVPYILAVTVFIALLELMVASKMSSLTLRQVGHALFQSFVYNNFFCTFISVAMRLCVVRCLKVGKKREAVYCT